MYQTIVSTEVLADHLDDPKWVVLDCRFNVTQPEWGPQVYRKSHIPGARYANLDTDLSSPLTPDSGRHPLPDPAALAGKLGAWGISGDTQVVVYDEMAGAVAARTWWSLGWLGHQNAALLNGGYEKWCDEKRPVTDQLPQLHRADFRGRANDSMWVTTADVERLVGNDDVALIDARAPGRFSGESETVDAVGGHIPGAVNHPLMNNLDESGCFLPAERLREQYQELQKPTTIHSCGSGVTACHNLLAMKIAGFADARLYVGSWSEWIRSPERPVETGP